MKRLLPILALILPFFVQAQCNSLRKKTDKFDGKVNIFTDTSEPLFLHKVIEKGKPTYYLSLRAPASPTASRKGVYILFEDQTKLEWPDEDVEIEVTSYHPRWDAPTQAKSFVELNDDQLQKIVTKRITDYKLYVYDWSVRSKLGEAFRKLAECLVNATPENTKER